MNDSTFSNSEFQKLHQAEEALNEFFSEKVNEPRTVKNPSKESIDNILAYSKALSVRKSNQVDFIENILN